MNETCGAYLPRILCSMAFWFVILFAISYNFLFEYFTHFTYFVRLVSAPLSVFSLPVSSSGCLAC